MTLFDPPEIETARLRLSPIRRGDAEDARLIWVEDPEVTRFVGWPSLTEPAAAERFVAGEARAWTTNDACRGWIARERGEAIGAVIARRHGRDAEFSYVVRRARWGRGLATEMATGLLLRARRDDELDELWAVCDVDNAASARVLEKAGFTFECLLPSHGRHRGFESRRDCRRYKALVSGSGS